MRTGVLAILAALCAVCAASASSVAYRKQVVLSVPVHVVYANLNDPGVKVTVAMSELGRGSSERASSMVSRTHPTAAITGTFFDTRSLLPTGDIMISGTRVHSGCLGPVLCISPDNRASIAPHKLRTRRTDAEQEMLLAGGPTLAYDGRVSLNPRAEGFSHPGIFRAARRTAAGITAANKLILASVNHPISLNRLAGIMLALGANQAILLDGGSSTAMYADGRFVSTPGRRLTNMLLVYEKRETYLQAAGQLAPTLITASQVADYEKIARAAQSGETPELWYHQLIKYSESFGSISLSGIGGYTLATLMPRTAN